MIIKMIKYVIVTLRWRSTTLTSRWATLRRTSRLMQIQASGRGWTSPYRSRWWWWLRRGWNIKIHISRLIVYLYQIANCSGCKWPSEKGWEGQVIYFHIYQQSWSSSACLSPVQWPWSYINQDEHRFKRPVLASQRGFTVAREQDDVRRLQHRGGHGHHHTGAWS